MCIRDRRYATEIMLGKKLKELGLKSRACRLLGVKEAVFPFNMFPEVDPVLGPEMRATGEVMGLSLIHICGSPDLGRFRGGLLPDDRSHGRLQRHRHESGG